MLNKIMIFPLAAAMLAGCSGMHRMQAPQVPAAIAVPAGNTMAMMAKGIGELTYECRVKANTPDTYEWAFAGPNAVLYDEHRSAVGKYYAGPTWEHNDASKVTGKQLSVSPGGAGAIALQLVQADPATGNGEMTGVTFIQRVNTVGGVAPSKPCGAGNAGSKELVNYQADYVFYKKN